MPEPKFLRRGAGLMGQPLFQVLADAGRYVNLKYEYRSRTVGVLDLSGQAGEAMDAAWVSRMLRAA